ncbi:hypothetical protein GCM10027019_14490 [Melaminivora jejuensis]
MWATRLSPNERTPTFIHFYLHRTQNGLLARKDAMHPAAVTAASADLQGLDIDSLLGTGNGTVKLNF